MTINNRYDFMILFDVENGNPNGDPDAGNAPRIDAETGCGFVTDVCLKRKIRNYVELKNSMGLCQEDGKGYNILIKPDKALNSKFTEAYVAEGLELKQKGKKPDDVIKARDYICRNYYDVRTFGAVMSTGEDPCGIVRGPVQINFARSLSPINIQDITITRQARTTEDRQTTGETEMGRKSVVPYALYKSEGYISAALAEKTGLSDTDIDILWEALENMFEHDHSAARGKMCMRKLYIFKHNSILGSCSSHILFEKIKIDLKNKDFPPRNFEDYIITVDKDMPEGIELIER